MPSRNRKRVNKLRKAQKLLSMSVSLHVVHDPQLDESRADVAMQIALLRTAIQPREGAPRFATSMRDTFTRKLRVAASAWLRASQLKVIVDPRGCMPGMRRAPPVPTLATETLSYEMMNRWIGASRLHGINCACHSKHEVQGVLFKPLCQIGNSAERCVHNMCTAISPRARSMLAKCVLRTAIVSRRTDMLAERLFQIRLSMLCVGPKC